MVHPPSRTRHPMHPRTLTALLLALVLALSLVPANGALAASGDTLVWKTATGKKYHSKNDCGNTNSKKAKQVTLKDAVEKYGLERCSKCSPPKYDGTKKDSEADAKTPSSVTTTAKAKLYKKADSSSTVLKTIPKGTKLTTLDSTSKYYKVKYDGSTGYVRKSDTK